MAERRERERSAGFTLIEVLMATLLFGIAFATMTRAVTLYLRALSGTRDEIVASELGQRTLRDVAARIEQGEDVEPESGRYDGEFAELRYEVQIESYTVPIPGGVELDPTVPVASIFTPLSVNADTPDSPLRRVVVRVYREGSDAESARPLLAIVSVPVDAPPGGAPGEDGQSNFQEDPRGGSSPR